jgi:hypothetical protein
MGTGKSITFFTVYRSQLYPPFNRLRIRLLDVLSNRNKGYRRFLPIKELLNFPGGEFSSKVLDRQRGKENSWRKASVRLLAKRIHRSRGRREQGDVCVCVLHGLIKFIDNKVKCRHLQNFTCKGTLRQVVFIRVYRLEIQSVMLVFSTQI